MFATLATVLTEARPSAQDVNACADCHLQLTDVAGGVHVQSWDRSAHGRNNVGCEKCHGGDASSAIYARAHRDIIRPANVRSPLNPRNLGATCGSCHTGQYAAFQGSRHYQLLQSGSNKGPTCITCHGDINGWLLSPKSLEASNVNSVEAMVTMIAVARQFEMQMKMLSNAEENARQATRLLSSN